MAKDGNLVATPRLRFPEYRALDGWKNISLGQTLDFRSGGTPSKNVPAFWNGTIPWVTAKDMKQLFLDDTEDHITMAALNDGARQVPAATVLMLTRGMTLLKDVPICVLRRSMSFNQDVKALIPKEDLASSFLPWLLLGNKSRLLGMVDVAGHGTGKLNTDELKALEVMLPRSSEQQKIAECLTSLDELIAAQGRKVETLKAHKKGLMQQLFPREGETVPRFRFSEFRDAPEWEQTNFDHLVDFQSGGTPSKANSAFWNGSIPWVSAKDMKQLFLDDSEDRITTAAIDDGAKVVPTGTVLMLVRGMTLLKDVPICVARREMSFNQDVKALRPKVRLAGLFLAYLLMGNKQRLLTIVDVAGHGTGKLSTDELKALELVIPVTQMEQQQIADCLSSLDAQISAEMEKLDALKLHKAGLMQQLFPTPGISQDISAEDAFVHRKADQAAVPSPKPYQVGFARQLLAAEILQHCHKHPTMGRVKLQKLIHLCEYHAELDDIHGNYARAAAGPFDNKLMRGVASGLEKLKWFKQVRDENRSYYEPMESSGQHAKYIQRWSKQLPKIREVIQLFETAATLRCEIASTLYAAWNDLLIDGLHPTDEEIIREASDSKRWHESKATIEKSKWPTALQWMRERGLVPCGYGAHTTKSGE